MFQQTRNLGNNQPKANRAPSTPQSEWVYQIGSWIRSSPKVADVDNDGKTEIVMGSADHYIYCINGTG